MITAFVRSLTVNNHAAKAKKQSWKLSDLSVIEYFQQDTNQQGHLFSPNNMLIVVQKGELCLTQGKQHHLLKESQMAFIKKNKMFYYSTSANNTSKTEWMLFTITHEIATEYNCIAHPVTSVGSVPEIAITILRNNTAHYISTLKSHFELQVSNTNKVFIKLKLLELLCCLSEEDMPTLGLLLNLRKDFRPDITTTIEKHLTEPLSIRQLATLCGRSPASFLRDFHAIYKMPPSAWIREKRLQKAEVFLRDTRMPVTDICYYLGFENVAHFSRLFKSRFGISPTEYRQKRVVA